jgi:hypothetical protein
MAKKFGSASAFKASLEAHLRKRSEQSGVPFDTLRMKFVMERLLARLFHDEAPPWLLKGGFAMDLRFRPQARTTKDIDLTFVLVANAPGPVSAEMRDRLQAAADHDLGDYLSFRIGAPKKELTNAPLGGGRYPCEAVLVGKTYAKFHIDLGVGDAVVGAPDRLLGDDLLAFAGIDPMLALAIPKAQQFAEKIHAYTFPWSGRVNTRTKDLIDLVILIERGMPDPAAIRIALAATFSARGTHPLPASLPPPPDTWKDEFALMAAEAKITTADYLAAFRFLEGFWKDNALATAAE